MHTTPKQQQGKAQTIKKKQNQQNTPQQHHWPGEANTAKSIENFKGVTPLKISPVFLFKKTGANQNRSKRCSYRFPRKSCPNPYVDFIK